MESLSRGGNLGDASGAATAAFDSEEEASTELLGLLETSLDRVLRALGLEIGAIWLHPHRVVRGLPQEVVEIGKVAAYSGLCVRQVQAIPDWRKVEETHPQLVPLAGVMERLGIRASVAVSLEREGRSGGLAVAAPQPRAWTGTEVALVEAMANLLEMVIKALETEKKRRNSEQRYRHLFHNTVSSVAVCEAIDNGGNFVLADINRAAERMQGRRKEELLGRKVTEVFPEVLEFGLLEVFRKVWKTGEPEHYAAVKYTDARRAAWVEYYVYKLPSGEIVAVYNDVTERKQLEEEIRHQAARAEALLRTASRLNAQLDLDRVLKVVCEEAGAALHVPMAAVFLHDNRRDALSLAASSGVPQELAERMKLLPRSLYEQYVLKEEPIAVISDLRAVPDPSVADLGLDYNLCTGVGARMQRDGHLIGVLALIASGDERRFTAEELALLQGLADQATQAITNARLFEETRRRLKLVQALRNIDMAIAGSFDLRLTFGVALDEITAQLGMDAAAILLFNPHTVMLEYAAWRGFRTGAVRRLRLCLGEGYAGRAALERRTIHIPFLPEAERDPAQAPLLADEGFVSYYAVPLIAKGQIQGVLEVCHRSPVDPDGEWLRFLETLAGQAAIATDNVALLDQLQRSHLELVLAYDATIEGWARALDLRDRETEGHSRRVMEMTLRLARAVGMKEEELVNVRRGALLHDIGKVGVPDSILLKPGSLTPEEWEIMRRHPQYAYEMLSPIDYLRPALDIPYCHHEKWDGTGYPRGLKGEQIPLSARIFAIVDVWDALSSDRPYRPAWPPEKVRAYLKDEAGRHFDPQVLEAFLKILEEEGHGI